MKLVKISITQTITAISVALLAALSSFGGDRPANFVEYIETAGNGTTGTQWLRLDYTPSSRAIIEFEAALVKNKNQTHNFFCARGGTKANTFTLFWLANKGLRWDYNNANGSKYINSPALEDKFAVKVDGGDFYFNNGADTSPTLATAAFTVGGRLMLFASYETSDESPTGNYAAIRLYSFKVTDRGETIYDLHPCVDAAGVAGLYDTVSQKILYSMGEDAFTAGAAVPTLWVEGDPAELGKTAPAYGWRSVTDGEELSCTAPATVQNSQARATLLGWQLFEGASEEPAETGGESPAVFTARSGLTFLRWIWDAELNLAVKQTANGTVTAEEGWHDAGEETELTAVPEEGYAFAGWQGDVPDAQRKENPLTLTMDAARTVWAHFVPVGAKIVDYANGDDENGEGTVAKPWKTAAYAIGKANAGDTVVLLAGRHDLAARLAVSKAITLRGSGENWESVIDGKGMVSGIDVSVAGALLHNFTLANAGAQWAGAAGINMTKASTISNVVIRETGNLWRKPSDGVRFPLTISAGLATHCWITNNIAPNNAGVGISGSAVLENCYIADNVDRAGSTTDGYRGIVNVNGGTVRNCTIVNNTSAYSALFCRNTGAKIYNNIIWGNQGDAGTGNWKISVNLPQANWKGNCTYPLYGSEEYGNIDSDPLLMSDSLHFLKTSPCNGTAVADLAPAYDIHCNARGETPSMGCLEYEKPEGFAVTILASAESVELPQTIDLTTAIDGDAAEPIHYAWDFDGDGEVDSEEPQPTLDEPGKYHVSLTMTDFNGKTASAAYGSELIVAPKGGFVIFVSPNGDGTDPYGGFATGFSTIQAAIDFASPGDNIKLDRTTFLLSSGITLEKKVNIFGAGENWETILDGQDADRNIVIKSAGALLHSFTFTRIGARNSGSNGLTLANDSIVSNVVARGNGNGFIGDSGAGTRFVWTVSAGLVTHCWSTNNIAPCNAGVTMTGGTIENSYFADNVDSGYGTRSEYWGIFRMEGGTVRNCTIVNNRSSLGAIYYKSGNLYNNIIWGNTPNGSSEVNNWTLNGTPSMNNWKGNCTMPLAGTEANGNIAADPLLLDDNLHFFKNSPCNGTAVVSLAAATDLDGNVRGDQPSMGAVEYLAGALACTISASSTTADQPAKIVLKCEIDGDVTGEVTYDWDLTGDGSLPVVHGAEVELTGIGLYHPSVKVFVDGQLKATATSQTELAVYGEGGTVYVTSGENPNAKPPYATWETAATNMVDAYAYAQAGKEMLLDAGTHFLSGVFEVDRAVKIRAVEGPEKTFLANPKSSPTKDVGHLMLLKADGCLLEGVTIRDQNFANNSGNGAMMGVIRGTLRNCWFLSNRSSGHGGVSTEGGANAVIENCVFRGNVTPVGATQGPTCVRLSGSKSILRNCLFENNTNTYTRVDDASYRGCAVVVLEQNALIANCTFVGNITSNGFNSVVNNQTMNGTFCMANVKNCVSTGNFKTVDGVVVPSNELGEDASGGLCTKVSNSLVWPTDADYSGFTKVLTVDPQFVDAANGDYHLRAGSPAVNGGDNLDYTAESIDLDGKARIYRFGLKSSKADMGCYESPYGTPGLSVVVR